MLSRLMDDTFPREFDNDVCRVIHHRFDQSSGHMEVPAWCRWKCGRAIPQLAAI